MTYKYIEEQAINDAISLITLKRPEKRNALNIALMDELCTAFEGLQKKPQVRIVIIHGSGSVFCSGLDLYESTDTTLIEKMAQHVARLLKTIYTSPLVTIAAVQGDAIAGGAGLVTACDYVLMANEAKIGFPETRRGLVAAQVATLLRRQIRMRDVRELLLLGELIDAQRAVAIGLANRVVNAQHLISESMKIAEIILQGSPEATKNTKRLLDSLDPNRFYDDLEIALSMHQTVRHSEEAKEGIAAFLEKRPPKWSRKHASI